MCGMAMRLIFGCMLFSFVASAQSGDASLKSYFSEIQNGKYSAIPKFLLVPENVSTTLKNIIPYLKDSSANVRAKAYLIVQRAAHGVNETSIRQNAVTKLIQACKDNDSGNVGLALGYLEGFTKKDYTKASQDTLVKLFKRRIPHYDKLIRLIGFLEIKAVQEDLQTLSQQTTAIKKERWSAMLALARMGDVGAIQNMMMRVKKLPINDDVVYEIFPDLVYSRSKEAFNYLVQLLYSDDKNCEPAGADGKGKIPCAYRIMEMLAPAIVGYPLKVDDSGDIITKDYVAALKTSRNWFTAHPDYSISKSKY
jgi:hypothetical protein